MAVEYSVCGTCGGSGKIVNPVLSVWTDEDRDNDPDGFEGMMSGVYDINCTECGGVRVTTAATRRDYRERRAEHFLRLREQGLGPGHPDYF